jgi:non-ribosomal peptide synthetase component F
MLTYDALNRHANQLAHHLQELGVGPEVLVGICMHRSLEMAIGLLAVLKAGGAYVPLDPAYPDERLAFLMADAHLSVLLTHQRLQRPLPPSAAHVIVLEQSWERLLCLLDQNPMSTVSAQNVAYVIYTSGSTGVPKGVQVPHGSIANLVQAQVSILGDTETRQRMLQSASFSFDVSSLRSLWHY